MFSSKNNLLRGIYRMNSIKDEKNTEEVNEDTKEIRSVIKNIKRQPSIVDFEYLAEFGEVEEYKQVKYLEAGDSFGEFALITNKPRTCTVEALEDTYLAVISKKEFNQILCTHAAESLEEKDSMLQGIPFFQNVAKSTLQKFSYSFLEITYRKDQIVYEENSDFENIYFIKAGEFKILKGELYTSDKFKYSDNLLKLSLMKKLIKRKKFSEIIKSNMEMFGYEELIENSQKRTRKCVCYSSFGQLYECKIDVFFI